MDRDFKRDPGARRDRRQFQVGQTLGNPRTREQVVVTPQSQSFFSRHRRQFQNNPR